MGQWVGPGAQKRLLEDFTRNIFAVCVYIINHYPYSTSETKYHINQGISIFGLVGPWVGPRSNFLRVSGLPVSCNFFVTINGIISYCLQAKSFMTIRLTLN